MWIPQCAQCFLHFWRYNNIPWKPVCHWDFDILMWLLPSWCDFLPTRCYMGLMWLLPNWCDLNPSLVSATGARIERYWEPQTRSRLTETISNYSWRSDFVSLALKAPCPRSALVRFCGAKMQFLHVKCGSENWVQLKSTCSISHIPLRNCIFFWGSFQIFRKT